MRRSVTDASRAWSTGRVHRSARGVGAGCRAVRAGAGGPPGGTPGRYPLALPGRGGIIPDLPGAGTVVIGAKTPSRPGQAGFRYFLLIFK